MSVSHGFKGKFRETNGRGNREKRFTHVDNAIRLTFFPWRNVQHQLLLRGSGRRRASS